MKKRGSSTLVIIVALIIMGILFFVKNKSEEKESSSDNQINVPSAQSKEQEKQEPIQESPIASEDNSQINPPIVNELANCLQRLTLDKIPTSIKSFKSESQISDAGKPSKFVGTIYLNLNDKIRNLPSIGYKSNYVSPTNYYNNQGQLVRISVIASKINNQNDYDSILDDLKILKDKGSVNESNLKSAKLYMIDYSNKTSTSNKWYSTPGEQQYLQFSFEGINSED